MKLIKQHVITVLFFLTYVPTIISVEFFSPKEKKYYDTIVDATTKKIITDYDRHLKMALNHGLSPRTAKIRALLATTEDMDEYNKKNKTVYKLSAATLDSLTGEISVLEEIRNRCLQSLADSNDINHEKAQRLIAFCEQKIQGLEEEKQQLIMDCAVYRPESPYHQEIETVVANLILETELRRGNRSDTYQDPDSYIKSKLNKQNLLLRIQPPSALEKKMVLLVMRFSEAIQLLQGRSKSAPVLSSPKEVPERPLKRSKSLAQGFDQLDQLKELAASLQDMVIADDEHSMPSSTAGERIQNIDSASEQCLNQQTETADTPQLQYPDAN